MVYCTSCAELTEHEIIDAADGYEVGLCQDTRCGYIVIVRDKTVKYRRKKSYERE